MLSILIPVYNFDPCHLVLDLHRQATLLKIPFEIRCYDDASTFEPTWIKPLSGAYDHLIIKVLSKNMGRAAIRNLLAKEAKYDYLLFMDCDSRVVQDDYLFQYIQVMQSFGVVYGGRVYQKVFSGPADLYLHWLYGSRREQIPAKKRQKSPYRSFMTNNFVVKRQYLLDHPFDERLVQYGHEDTLFGLGLLQNGVSILHIDNALEHIGLENHQVFLEKSEKALQNLHFLYRQGISLDTKVLKAYKWLHTLGMVYLFAGFARLLNPILRRQILSSRPSLRAFDGYKLGYFVREVEGKR